MMGKSIEIIGIWFGRYWCKKDLQLLADAIERGADDFDDLTNDEYVILMSTVKNIKNMVK